MVEAHVFWDDEGLSIHDVLAALGKTEVVVTGREVKELPSDAA